MIVTVTLNPTLDKTLSVPRLRPGELHRARFIRQDLGGKGINVSRALAALGIASRPVCFLAGATGQAMRAGLLAGGFDVTFVAVDGETRQNLTLLDESTGIYTKINEPGPSVGPHHLKAMQELVGQTAGPGDLWAFCGSLPPSAPDEFYASLIELVQRRGARAFLDTSGRGLDRGLEARPYALKPNAEETESLLGVTLADDADYGDAVSRLHARGVSLVCLSRGAQGLVLGTDGRLIRAHVPSITARSPIGAGDAALAGLIWATVDQSDPRETAARAAACGAAAAMQEGTGIGGRELVEELMGRVETRE